MDICPDFISVCYQFLPEFLHDNNYDFKTHFDVAEVYFCSK